MDRVTKGLLDEFSTDNGILEESEDVQFEHFATYLSLSRHYNDPYELTDVITGSGNDTGIDGLAILVNGTVVSEVEHIQELSSTNGFLDVTFVFVQAERSSSFDTAKIGLFSFGVTDFFSDRPKLPRNRTITEAYSIMTEIYKKSSIFKKGNPACKLYYVTTGKWIGDQALEARKNSTIEDIRKLNLFSEVNFYPIDADAIQKLYRQTKNAINREFNFPLKTVIPEIPGVTEAYIGILPATDFIRLLHDDSGEMLRTIFALRQKLGSLIA